MKNKTSNTLIKLVLLIASSFLVISVIIFNKNLTALHAQDIYQISASQNLPNFLKFMNSKISLRNKNAKSRQIVSVRKFGAVGNGKVDDTKAIQAAINEIYKTGGGTVFFPRGIYKVSITRPKLHAITIRGKITLQGSGNQESVIQLADKQGNYNAILGGEESGEVPDFDLSDFAMYDLAIDGNGLQNPILAESELTNTNMRHSVRIVWGSRINIERCKFLNQNNVNVVSVNGPQLNDVSNVSIKNNIFKLIGGGNIDYDHSTIYTYGKYIKIENNYLSSRYGAGTNGARAAIEIHGDEHIVKNNVIVGFLHGINVTGFAKSSNNQFITNNLIKEALNGIVIWSYFSFGNTTNSALSNCTIADNKINLNVDAWRRLLRGNTVGGGIVLEAKSDAPIENLNIINNEISFKKLLSRGYEADALTTGIRLWRYAAPNVISENIKIVNNKIQNSLAAGIYIYMPIKGGEVSQNTILNPAKSDGKFDDGYRAAMILDGSFEDMKINDNLLIDNQKNQTIKGGIISQANCRTKCEASGNKLQVSSGAKFPVFRLISQENNNFKVSD